MASGGNEASSLAAASTVAGANFIARTTVASIASGNTETVKQSRQIEPRQVKQVSVRTTVVVSATIEAISSTVARIATVEAVAVADNIARIATIKAIGSTIARIAIVEATSVQAKTLERVQITKREPWCDTTVGISAGIAICDNVARTAISIVAISSTIARTAQCGTSKQVPQASAQSEAGHVADCVTWIAYCRIT